MAYASASQSGYGSGPSVIHIDASHPDVVSISDAELLFTGHLERKGPDLLLTGHDGRHHIIPGYFSAEHNADLVAPNGARITGDLVGLLAGSAAPGQYAQTPSAVPTDAIGRIEKVVGNVTVMRNGVAVALHVGDAVYKNDVVQTGADSSAGIGFADGTALNLVANTRMALNDYVYDPNGSSNVALFNLVQGGFAFVAGKVAHTGDMKIGTPVATMGIRGTTGYALENVATVSANLGNVTMSFAVVADPGSDRVGQYDLIDQFGNVVAVVGRAGVWTNVSSQGLNQPLSISTQQMTASNFGIEQQLIPALVQILNSLGNLTPTPQSGPNNPGSSTPPIFELINLPQTLQQNSGTSFAINVPVNGPNGPTATPGTVTITTNPTAELTTTNDVWIGSNGIWERAANWSDDAVPVAPINTAEIDSGKVTITAAEAIAGLTIGTGAILNIISGGSLVLSNSVANSGVLQLNSSGADPTIAINGTVYLLNNGKLALLGPTGENLIVGVGGTGATLVNVNNTIIGSGTIGQGDGALTLINGAAGTIEAKPLGAADSGLLVIDTGNIVSNSGVLEAVAGGTLQIDDLVTNLGMIGALAGGSVLFVDDTVTNNGFIGANGADTMVGLEHAYIDGGTLGTANGGVIETLSGMSTFLDVTIANGSFVDTSANTMLGLQGSTVLDGGIAFEGQGTFKLEGAGAEITGESNTRVELDNFGTISGEGKIGADDRHFLLDNESSGVIDASGKRALIIDNDSRGSAGSQPGNAVINTGMMEATGHGGLTIDNTTISNATDAAHDTGQVDVLTRSRITLDNATILNGFVSIDSGGEMLTANGTSNTIDTADGQDNLSTVTLSNAGELLVGDNSSLTLASPDAIDNSGTIKLDSTGHVTRLVFDQPDAGIDGGGQIVLSDNIKNVIAVTHSGDQLTNFDNTISGSGTIGGTVAMVLVNDGIIDADHHNAELTLDPTSLTNSGTLEATDRATLVINDTTVNNGTFLFNNAINDPVAQNFTAPSGLNDSGEVVGNYLANGSLHGFIDSNGHYTTLDDSLGVKGTQAYGINNAGQIVGYYLDADSITHGFFYSNGSYTTLNDPLGADGTRAYGINNVGQIVGDYIDVNGGSHGFVFAANAYTTLDDPLAVSGTYAKGINDAGQIVGYYYDANNNVHGFVDNGGTYTTLNDPSAAGGTYAEGINNAGQIVGYYFDAAGAAHIFIYSNGAYFNYTDPSAAAGAGEGSNAFAINNAGQIAGYYLDSGFNGIGFVADPPEASGTITANRGTTVDLVNSTVTGGTVDVAGVLDSTGTSAIVDAAIDNHRTGTIESTGGGTLTIDSAALDNHGTLKVTQGSTLDVSADVSGKGKVVIRGDGTANFTGAFNEHVWFAGAGTLALAQSYIGTVSGFGKGDAIDLTDFAYSRREYAIWNDGYLYIYKGAKLEQTISVSGSYAPNNFAVVGDGSGGTEVVYQQPVDKWKHSHNGTWSNGSNWSQGAAPTSGTEAAIDRSGTYKVAASGQITVKSLAIGDTGATLVGSGGLSAKSLYNAGTIRPAGEQTFTLTTNRLFNADTGVIQAKGEQTFTINERGNGNANFGTIAAFAGAFVTINHGGTATNERGGVIEAVNGSSLVLHNNEGDANHGLIKAASSGTLKITVAPTDDTGSGGNYHKMEAVPGGTLSLVGDMLNRGAATIDATGTGSTVVFSPDHRFTHDDVVINKGIVVASSGGKLDVQDHKIYNTGTGLHGINVNGASSELLVDTASLHLTGGGDVTLANGLITENADNPLLVGSGAILSLDLDNIDNTIEGGGTIGLGDGHFKLLNQAKGTINANVSGETLTIDTGNTVINKGTLEATGGGALIVDDAVKGSGSDTVSHGGILDFQSTVSADQTVTFSGRAGTIALSDPAGFHGLITGLVKGDTIDLTKIAPSDIVSVKIHHGESATWLVVNETDNTQVKFNIAGNLTGNYFNVVSDHNGGTNLVLEPSFYHGQINTNGVYTPQISNGGSTLELTNGNYGEAASWFSNTKYSVDNFTASFDYQAIGTPGSPLGPADGTAFILQNSAASNAALGGSGSGLGYSGISPSAAVEFNIYDGHTHGTNFATNGGTEAYNSTNPVDFWDTGDTIQVALSYNGTLLTETLTDLVTGATYSTSYTENLRSVLGSGTAYVGFSAATGSGASTQTVSDFNFQFDSPTHWAGASGDDWTTANDWTDGNSNVVTTPNSTNAVFIGESGAYTLEITSADTAGSLTITSAGAGADVQDEIGGALSVAGALTIDAGSFSLIGGSLAASSIYVGSAGRFIAEGTVQAPLDNAGGFVEAHGNLSLLSTVVGTGNFQIDAGNTLELGSFVAGGTVTFGASTGTLRLDDPADFHATVAGVAASGDVLNLIGYDTSATASTAGGYDAGTNTTTLTVTDPGHTTLEFSLAGDLSASSWSGTENSGNTGVNIFDPPATASATGAKGSVSISGPNSDAFVFHPGMGAETATNFNPKADTIELDHFANIDSVHQLASLITTDVQGDPVIGLGHHDSITLPGVNANYLQAHLHSLVHLG